MAACLGVGMSGPTLSPFLFLEKKLFSGMLKRFSHLQEDIFYLRGMGVQACV